jgi:hypothetical protein
MEVLSGGILGERCSLKRYSVIFVPCENRCVSCALYRKVAVSS